MSKLLSILVAGLFAAGAASAMTPGAAAPNNSNYTANPASGGDTSLNKSTDTAKLYGSSSSKAAGQQLATNDKEKDKDKKDKKDKSAFNLHQPKQQLAANDKDKPCPPGLEKKNNGCMPPGQANHAKAPNTRALGAGPNLLRDRDHDRDEHRKIRHHRKHGKD